MFPLSSSPAGHTFASDEWSVLGNRDIDHTTRGARVRSRVAIESIRCGAFALDESAVVGSDQRYPPLWPGDLRIDGDRMAVADAGRSEAGVNADRGFRMRKDTRCVDLSRAVQERGDHAGPERKKIITPPRRPRWRILFGISAFSNYTTAWLRRRCGP